MKTKIKQAQIHLEEIKNMALIENITRENSLRLCDYKHH